MPEESHAQFHAMVGARLRHAEEERQRLADARRSHSARPRLEIDLLGSVRVRWLGRQIPSVGAHGDSLIALLALRGSPRSREDVATELWPDGGRASLAWLRQTIWKLRRAIGAGADDVLLADHDRVGFAVGLDLDVDVAAFEAALAARPARPAEAVALYRGDLLEGSSLECFAHDRERLADLFEDALAATSAACLARGDLDGAREAATRLVGRDPLREDAHALLITVHGLRGERAQVVRQYRRVRHLLADELAVVPLPETELAYQAALEAATRRSRRRAAELDAGGRNAARHPAGPGPRERAPEHVDPASADGAQSRVRRDA